MKQINKPVESITINDETEKILSKLFSSVLSKDNIVIVEQPLKKKKLLVTFSGGETSAFMGQWLNKNLQDEYDMVFVFANTGVESNETLDFVNRCEKEFGLDINWIEGKVYHNKRKSTGFTLVNYETATRNTDWKTRDNTPFEEIVKKYGIPNHSRLHCTREMKMNPIKAFAKSIWGKEKYYLALGIRIDEIDRMNDKKHELRLIYPLISLIKMTKKHINFWWANQKFRLNLKGYQGNCGACFKKNINKLQQMVLDDINYFEFLVYLEDKYGNPNGKIPQKIIQIEIEIDENGTKYEVAVLETLPKEEYKNVFFRNFISAREMIEMAKDFRGGIIDDHIEEESCEVFSNCGS